MCACRRPRSARSWRCRRSSSWLLRSGSSFFRHTAAQVAHGGLELLPLPLLALVELAPLLLVVDVDALAALLHGCPALVRHLLFVGAFFCDVGFLLGRAALGVSLPSEAVLSGASDRR